MRTSSGPHGPPKQRPQRRGLLGGLLITTFLVALSTSLGVWQVYRLGWKERILHAINRAEQSPPVPLPLHPARFQKVVVSGTLDPTHAVGYADVVRDAPDGTPVEGTELIEPLLRPGHPPLLAVLGWTRFPPHPVSGPATLTGYVRPPEQRSWLLPHDDLAHGRTYALDPPTIGRELGLPPVAPFTLVVLGPHGDPDPQQALPRPPNNHLQYAITWFTMSVVLAVMFGIWVVRGDPSERRDGA